MRLVEGLAPQLLARLRLLLREPSLRPLRLRAQDRLEALAFPALGGRLLAELPADLLAGRARRQLRRLLLERVVDAVRAAPLHQPREPVLPPLPPVDLRRSQDLPVLDVDGARHSLRLVGLPPRLLGERRSGVAGRRGRRLLGRLRPRDLPRRPLSQLRRRRQAQADLPQRADAADQEVESLDLRDVADSDGGCGVLRSEHGELPVLPELLDDDAERRAAAAAARDGVHTRHLALGEVGEGAAPRRRRSGGAAVDDCGPIGHVRSGPPQHGQRAEQLPPALEPGVCAVVHDQDFLVVHG